MNKKKMIEEAMGRIMYVRELQEAHLAGISFLQRKDRNYQRGDQKIFNDLMRAELEEWRNLLIWGLVADNDTQDRIKGAAHERFLSDRTHVAQWFNNGESPSHWLASEEREFREMAKKAFAPREEDA